MNIVDPHNWTVKVDGTRWIGRLVHSTLDRPIRGASVYPTNGYIDIMPASFPYELAIDAFTDFISRLNNGLIPRGLTEPRELMELCVSAARRQR